MKEQSYMEYRQEKEELNFKKQKILKTIQQKKQAHAKYREWHKLYRDFDQEQTNLTKELIEMI